MKKLLFLFALTILLGCSNDDSNSESNDFNLTTESTSVLPLELIILKSNNTTFNNESYDAFFGDVEVTLAKNLYGDLVFAIPDVSDGDYDFSLTVDGKQAVIIFTVVENEVNDLETILQEELINPLNILKQDIDSFLLESEITNQDIIQLNSSNNMISSFLTQFENISEDEKIEVARFFKANPIFSTSFEEANRMMNGNEDFDCFKINAKRVVFTTASVILFVTEVLPAVAIAGPFGTITAIVGTIAGVYGAYTIISVAHQHLINDCFRPFSNLFQDEDGNINNSTFYNSNTKSFNILTRVRTLISTDTNDNNSLVSNVANKITIVSEKWTEFKEGLNSIISNTWFSGWFSSGNTNYNNIETNISPLPDSSPESQIPGKNAFVTVEGVPNDIIVNVETIGESGYNISFNTDNATLPRSFVMTINYDDGDFQTTDEFNVTLEEDDQYDIEGIWLYNTSNLNCSNGVSLGTVYFEFDSEGNVYVYPASAGATGTGTYQLSENNLAFSITFTFPDESDECDSGTSTNYNQITTVSYSGTLDNSDSGIGTMNANFQYQYTSGNSNCLPDNFTCNGNVTMSRL